MIMKKYIIFILLNLIALLNAQSQTGWFKQINPSANSIIRKLTFTDNNTGYAVGDNATIIKTTDGGISWSQKFIPGPPNLRSVSFPDSQTGYVAGFDEMAFTKILKTTNGGENWTVVGDQFFQRDPAWTVLFLDAQTGFVGSGPGKSIARTSDGGITWDLVFNDLRFDIYSIDFIDQSTGFATTNAYDLDTISELNSSILKTTDGGFNWEIIYTEEYGNLYNVNFTDGNTGYICGEGPDLIKTTNAGENWFSLPIGFDQVFIHSFYLNNDTGYMSSSNGLFIKTTNGGINWNTITLPEYFWGDIYFFSENTGVLAGRMGRILRTTNAGLNWTANIDQNSIGNLMDIDFYDGRGLICSSNGYILRTSGDAWESILVDSALSFRKITFADYNTAIAVSGNVNMMKTTDSGLHWFSVFENAGRPKLIDLHFYNIYKGDYIDVNGNMYRTINGGANWTLRGSSHYIGVTGAFFIDTNTAVHCTDFELTYKTTNAGINWQQIPSFMPFAHSDIIFMNANTGFIVGEFGSIARSGDGGNSWGNVNSGTETDFNSVYFPSVNKGFITGQFGKILKSTNGGLAWYSQISNTALNLNSVYFTSENTGYIAGNNGLLLKTTTGGELITNIFSETYSPGEFKLFQNYPNPFNPVTNLEFGISNPGFVSLKVYDILGNEIKTLVNEMKPAGSYTIVFDGSNLSSGIYFYSMFINGILYDSKRMILLK